jgi:5-methylcytosine-specific restriction endonuclease McrA
VSVIEQVSPNCPLLPKANGVPGICDLPGCGTPLGKYGRRWCRPEHGSAFYRLLLVGHDWKTSRDAAIDRDGGCCVTCGYDGGTAEMLTELATLGEEPEWPDLSSALDRIRAERRAAGKAGPRGGVGRLEDPYEDPVYAGAMKRVTEYNAARTRILERFARHPYGLEVNHIDPREGRGYAASCAHHLENLETLCRRCHAAVTARQARERANRRRGRIALFGNQL